MTTGELNKARRKGALLDRALVDRCLLGENDAWEELYWECQPRLLMHIETLLTQRRLSTHPADEVAARVWYAVLRNDAALLAAFDPSYNCRLRAYMAGLATKELLRFLRDQSRQRNRDNSAQPTQQPDSQLEYAELHDFLGTLTNRERAFCQQCISGEVEANHEYSQSNIWQLRHRIRQKLKAFYSA